MSKPSPANQEPVSSSSGQDQVKVPDAIRPKCPHCKTDPLRIKRLRYDFLDGVVAEVLFCSNLECRCALSIVLVGFEKPKSS